MALPKAIPYITDEFHSTQDIGWYGAAYFLTLFVPFPLSITRQPGCLAARYSS